MPLLLQALCAKYTICLHLAAIAALKAKGSGRKAFQAEGEERHSSSTALAESLWWSSFFANQQPPQAPGPTALALAPEKPQTCSDIWVVGGEREQRRLFWTRGPRLCFPPQQIR